MTPPRASTTASKQLAAVATAAIPVVMLSSLAMAAPATAAPVKTQSAPHGAIDGKSVLAAIQARTATGTSISAAVVATSVPRGVTAKAPITAQSPTAIKHTVAAGDTVSAIATRYGVSTESVLTRNKISATTVIHPGKVLTISGPTAGTAASAPSSTTATAAASYTVRSGDTLSGVAAQHNVSLATVFSLNGLNGSSVIHPGQKIKVGGQAAAAAPSSTTVKTAKAATGKKYVIKAGDTLSAIAASQNVSLSALASANSMDLKTPIYAGKTLVIPGIASAASDMVALAPSAAAPATLTPDQEVPSTFLHYVYPDAVVSDANKNKAALLAAPAPNQAQMKELVASTAASMGVDPALAMAFAQQESGFNHQSVSPANAIGTMQVIPDAGEWAAGLVGRKLNLLDPQDNVTAGIAIIRALQKGADTEDLAIAGYYQGQYSVSVHGLFDDTVNYVAGIKANRELFR
ncbi:lytic transglycosylase domain-containing protein [Arthrobacter sp. TMN-49]